MRESQIILVEGMPGTGKSSVAQFIDRQLRFNGAPSRWQHEERADHPVRLFYDSKRHKSWSDYIAEAESMWLHFSQIVQLSDRVVVLDAAVLQNHVRSMLLFGCDWNPILDLVHRIENILAPLNPTWIYLKPSNIEQNFQRVIQSRGQALMDLWLSAQERFPYASKVKEAGFAGFIAFWNEFDQISDRIFEGLNGEKLKLNVTGDNWKNSLKEVVTFFEFPTSVEASATQALQRYVGHYVPTHDECASDFEVRFEDGWLIIIFPHPNFDATAGPIGCFTETRLIPNGASQFLVAGWPHEIEFTEDSAGNVINALLSVTAEGWPNSTQAFFSA